MISRRRTRGAGEAGKSTQKKKPQVRKPLRVSANRGEGYNERSVPPVMVRGVDVRNIPLSSGKKGKAKPRRRYDVALNMPGVEMRLPSLPQVALSWRMASFLLVAALGTLIYHLWSSPQYRVQAAQISGLQRLSSADLNAIMDVRGETIFAIAPRQLEEKLQQALPELSAVHIEVALPGEVIVEVEERQPILAWKQEGRTVLVDANGVAFPMRDQNAAIPPLVVEAHGAPQMASSAVDAVEAQQFMPVEMVSAIVSMSGQAPKNTPLKYDPQRGLGWQEAAGWDVYFGDTRSMDVKLKLYEAIADKLDEDGISPALVSVEHVHLPYYRLER
jgi:cell division septal protein FtsQ